MELNHANALIVTPTLKWAGQFDGLPPFSEEARVMLLAIGLAESGFRTRVQNGGGPARGLWQFERHGGCAEFETLRKLAKFRMAARTLGFYAGRDETHAAISLGADNLACLMARAVLFLEQAALPDIKDSEEAYRQYLARWRPGKPSKQRFMKSHAAVLEMG